MINVESMLIKEFYVPLTETDEVVRDKEYARITLDADKVITESFKGYGVQWDPYLARPINDEEWERIVERVDYLRPTFIRCMIYAPIYSDGLDSNGEPIYDFDSNKIKELYRLLDYCESRGIEVVLGEWETPGRFGGGFEGITVDDSRWARMIGGVLNYLIHEKGYSCIHYFNYVNEANTEWSLCQDYDKWRVGIRYLYEELCKYHLNDKIQITGPDSVWDDEEIWLHNLAKDTETDSKIGLYDVHMYPTIEQIMNGEMQQRIQMQRGIVKSKDFYMTEVGMVTGKTDGDSQPYTKQYCYGVIMADCAAQIMNGGLSGVAIWDMDDAMHDQDNGFASSEIRSLKQWGFWNSVAGRIYNETQEEKIRPHFYTWSLLTHLFPKECSVIAPDEALTSFVGLRASAMKRVNKDGKVDVTVMVVNDSHVPREVDLQLKGLGLPQMEINQYNYFENDRITDEKGFPIKKLVWKEVDLEKGIHLELSSGGVIFLSTIEV